jgi:hypothetical protein
MATFKVTWEFQANTGATWSEVYYSTGSNALSAATLGQGMLTARLALLHKLNTFTQVRATQIDAQRNTAIYPINLTGSAALIIPVAGDPGTPASVGDAIVCILTAATGASRRLWLRGSLDEWIQRDPDTGKDAPPPNLIARLRTFFNAMPGDRIGIVKLKPQQPGPLKNLQILSVDGARRDGTSDLTLAAAPGYPFPSRVIIGGASQKDLPALKGHFSITKAPVGAVVTIPYQTPNGSVVNGGKAVCRQESYEDFSLMAPDACRFRNFGTRTTKNPLTRSRGSRRAARLRSSL